MKDFGKQNTRESIGLTKIEPFRIALNREGLNIITDTRIIVLRKKNVKRLIVYAVKNNKHVLSLKKKTYSEHTKRFITHKLLCSVK